MTILTKRNFILGTGATALSSCTIDNQLIGDGPKQPEFGKIADEALQARDMIFLQQPYVQQVAMNAAGYLVFPNLIEASFVLGGLYGKGAMFSGDNVVAHYSMTGASYGLQVGVQKFSMMLIFTTPMAMADFRQSLGFEFGADVEYALPNKGQAYGASSTSFYKPIYLLIYNQQGLLAGASVEGAVYRKL